MVLEVRACVWQHGKCDDDAQTQNDNDRETHTHTACSVPIDATHHTLPTYEMTNRLVATCWIIVCAFHESMVTTRTHTLASLLSVVFFSTFFVAKQFSAHRILCFLVHFSFLPSPGLPHAHTHNVRGAAIHIFIQSIQFVIKRSTHTRQRAFDKMRFLSMKMPPRSEHDRVFPNLSQ